MIIRIFLYSNNPHNGCAYASNQLAVFVRHSLAIMYNILQWFTDPASHMGS